MINYIIISKNLSSSQYLINNILIKNYQTRLYSICTSVHAGIDIVKEKDGIIDIIILDLSLDKTLQFLELLEKIDSKNYKNSIIAITDEPLKINLNNNSYIYKQVSIQDSDIISNINNLVELKKNQKQYSNKKNMIINYLYKLGYNFSQIGTKYLVEVLLILLENEINKCPKLETTIYPIVAEHYDTNVHNVKCVITSATRYMNAHCKLKNKYKISPMFIDKEIKTKTVINAFLLKNS